IEVAPSLEGTMMAALHQHQLLVVHQPAMRAAVLGDSLKVEQALAYGDRPLYPPVERAAVGHFLRACGCGARDVHQRRLFHAALLLPLEALRLPLGEIFDGIRTHAELDEMDRHAAVLVAPLAKRTMIAPSFT